jgi:CRP-like cAMP-binding protein
MSTPDPAKSRTGGALPRISLSKIVYTFCMVVRLKDIAEELGVSIVTVSKALRDRPDIGK